MKSVSRSPVLILTLLAASCAGSQASRTAQIAATTTTTPPSSVEGDVEPGWYAFPGVPLRTDEGSFYGHLIGLVPVEVLGPVEDGYRVALEIGGGRRELLATAFSSVIPHTCTRSAITMENGALRAEVAPGGVVQVLAMQGEWAEVSAGWGLSAIVPRAQLGLDACTDRGDEQREGPELVPQYSTVVPCLFPTTEPDRDTPAVEVDAGVRMEVLESASGWRRVRVRHGLTTFTGWLAAWADLPPDARPPLLPRGEGAPATCRRTTRALELGDEERITAPPGSVARGEDVWIPIVPSAVVVGPRAEVARGYLRVDGEPPEDALGPEEPCPTGVWEPWEMGLGRCFHPGIPLARTDADPRVDWVSGSAPELREPLREVRAQLDACARGEGEVTVELAIEADGTVRTATVVGEQTTRPADEARCVADRLRSLHVEEISGAAVVRVTVPFFAAQ